MKYLDLAIILLVLAAAPRVPADDAPPPSGKSAEASRAKKSEKPVRRLKGAFKGQAISPAESESDATAKPGPPAARPEVGKKTAAAHEKPLTIDNALVGSGSSPAKKSAPAAPVVPPPAPAPAVSVAAPVDINGHGEDYWRDKARKTRSRVEEAQKALDAAQNEEKRQENDFYAWDDGQYRDNVIKPAWDKAREETARAQKELDDARKAVEDLDDEARKAGAFPGWIRE